MLPELSDEKRAWYILQGYEIKEYNNAVRLWFLKGERHREDGPAIEYADGSCVWYFNGKLHREDGPAIERANGSKEWWINGKRHREDGPAIEWPDGTKEWCLNGLHMFKKEHKLAVAKLRSQNATS